MWPQWKRAAFALLNYPVLVGFALGMRWHHAHKGTWLWWPGFLVIGLPVLILDVLWTNWLWGTVFWRERPREWTYTVRLQRLKRRGEPEAFRQCNTLNRYDPGHC